MLPPAKKTFSLVTYNIHKGYSFGRIRFLLPEMREALKALSPDFVFLQEVQGEHKRREKRIQHWPSLPQCEYIAGKMWPYTVYGKNAIYQSGHHGNAILSKFAFESCENINLSVINRASRSILHGQIKLQTSENNPLNLHLLCVHLGLFKSERLVQSKALINRISQTIPSHEPVLIAGDFNDWQHDISELLWNELGIHEAFYRLHGEHARSFPAIRPAFCVDRIYFRGMNVIDVACLHGKPWRLLSDHVPLLASFELA